MGNDWATAYQDIFRKEREVRQSRRELLSVLEIRKLERELSKIRKKMEKVQKKKAIIEYKLGLI